MKQIYTESTEKIYLRLYGDGVPVDSSDNPTFSVSIMGSDAAPRLGDVGYESTGVYYLLSEFSETETQGVLKIVWDFIIDGDPMSRTDYVSVVTPYVNFFDIKAQAPVGTSDEEVEYAEQFARYLIDAYTGTNFGLTSKSINLKGSNQSVLVLPHRLERLDSVAVNDEVLWTRDPEFNEIGRILSVTDTNYGILSEKSDNVPSTNDFSDSPIWKRSYKYTVGGQFGWANIPDEVEYAAKILSDDYFCKEAGWKKRFVDQISASDWRVVFSDRQYKGTGNFYVDSILDKYKSIGMVLV